MIATDLDGVILNVYPALREGLLFHYGYDIYPTEQHKIEVPGIKRNDVVGCIRGILERFTPHMHPYPETNQALECIHKLTDEPIVIITARDVSLYDVTMEWCMSNLTVPVKLYCHPTKLELLCELDILCWVDDRLREANRMCDHMMDTFLINRSWNMGRQVKPRVTRVESLLGVVPYLSGRLC